jgi:putative oxidoreductase
VFWTWERYRDLGLLILRIGFGLGFVWFHGGPKLLGGPGRWASTGDAIVNFGVGGGFAFWGLLAGLAEGVGGLLFALGLFFRPTCLAMMCVMIVAATNHFATGEGTPAHAFKNAWLFAGLFFVGPGRYSLDAGRKRRRLERAEPRPETAASEAGSQV